MNMFVNGGSVVVVVVVVLDVVVVVVVDVVVVVVVIPVHAKQLGYVNNTIGTEGANVPVFCIV
jgi:hypothetical protein